MDLGLERAGMECTWQVEIDEYCLKVLDKHWPDVTKYKDVRDVGKHNLETVDLIAGGFPCQPHSVAGKQRGAEDDRNLWPEFIRIIRETRPRYVLAENVPGIISTYLDTVLSDLEDADYTARTLNLPACAFDAPHRRERIFIVAYTSWNGRGRKDRHQERLSDVGNTKKLGWDEGKIERSREDRQPKGKTGRSSGIISDSSPMLRTSIKRDEQDRILSEVLADPGSNRHNNSYRTEAFSDRGKIGIPIKNSKYTQWEFEPDVGRVAHGIPSRVDRLRGLGNAVVPQVAQYIGERIMMYEKKLQKMR